ncbi:F4 family fimbrial subunit [Citrobacter braakii]|uniref:F4 family fimbrial subunit n=1 Tax=Citrobacter braakii TaxID=57706 RepID=UPI00142A9A68|nr:fimbrial protein [Citrobacter braakii]ECX2002026.1 fimbrial protein [Salmonella enterica subsp. enterica serovar Newport]MBJ9048886.1 fimbrial protein [Citrobacter braakii]
MKKPISVLSFIPQFSHLTLLCLLSGGIPTGVLAAWSTPGENFSGELTLGGQVTNSRNPWGWKLMVGDDADMSLPASDRTSRNGEQTWSGLMKGQPIVLGKTLMSMPAGREGLAPRVNYSSGTSGTHLEWLKDGQGEMTLPVYDVADSVSPVGELSFRLRASMLLRHIEGGQPVYAPVYNDLSGNGLPPKGQTQNAESTAPQLCALFAGDGPAWLCTVATPVGDAVPLGRLTDSRLRQPQGVYGAAIVPGSGELRLRRDVMLSRWKTTLNVSITYQ